MPISPKNRCGVGMCCQNNEWELGNGKRGKSCCPAAANQQTGKSTLCPGYQLTKSRKKSPIEFNLSAARNAETETGTEVEVEAGSWQ